ncbi:MAG: acylneuraminate cytidylyltransferase family protein [Thermoflexales bacterium]|nr:acylneuraminate cytidylyltransferase family protein [Thermoflexales bacterium]
MTPYVVGVIFARGGSKGVPRKNIRPLNGKPLIAYAIETAHASRWIKRTFVSTDDEEIAAVARAYGAEVPFMRPAELAQDRTPEWLAWQHALRMIEAFDPAQPIDAFVSIPPTSPLRSVEDVDACVQLLLDSDADMVVTVRPAERNPYFNMVTLSDAHDARLVIPPSASIGRRQDAPVVYDMTTVAYAARPAYVLHANSIFEGRVKAVVVPTERAIDIDTETDFQIAEVLLSLAGR